MQRNDFEVLWWLNKSDGDPATGRAAQQQLTRLQALGVAVISRWHVLITVELRWRDYGGITVACINYGRITVELRWHVIITVGITVELR